MIRAKFNCLVVAKSEQEEEITLRAVASDTEENKKWCKWTPNGELTMSISNPDAMGKFTPGKEYYLDISKCE